MKASLIVASAWLFFGGSHLLLGWLPVREKFVMRYGPERFTAIYSVIATVSLLVLAAAVALHGDGGAAGPNLSQYPAGGYILGAVSFVGAVMLIAGLAGYGSSPMAILPQRIRESGGAGKEALPKPTGISRISRHPFFVGLILLMSAHALLASTLATSIFFAGFALLGILGIPMQDRKLKKLHGQIYEDYLKDSSTISLPVSKPNTSAQTAASWKPLVISLVVAIIMANMHILWKPTNGAAFAVLIAIFGSMATILALRSASRK